MRLHPLAIFQVRFAFSECLLPEDLLADVFECPVDAVVVHGGGLDVLDVSVLSETVGFLLADLPRVDFVALVAD